MTQYLPAGDAPNIKKPGQVQAIAILTLISGILNILASFGWILAAILGIFTTFGLTLLCVPFAMLPGILGIFELIYAAKLLPEHPKSVKPNQTIAILEIVCILTGNPYPLVVGILALIFYNDPTVQAYFAQLNAPQAIQTTG
jgi:hypothetical protein